MNFFLAFKFWDTTLAARPKPNNCIRSASAPHGCTVRLYPWLAIPLCGLLLSCTSSPPEGFDFKIAVAQDGRVKVEFDALGYQGPSPKSGQLSLTEQGRELDFSVDDGGDGEFGPGDSLIFLGTHLHGTHSWFDPWSAKNIYRLRVKQEGPGEEAANPGSAPLVMKNTRPVGTLLTRHFEYEQVRVALSKQGESSREAWYWQRLSHLDRQPFELTLPQGSPPKAIRVALAGLSADQAAADAGMPQHHVELFLAGQLIGSAEWNGQAVVEIIADTAKLAMALEQAVEPVAKLGVHVPVRSAPGQETSLIDVVLLNWIEMDFPETPGRDELSYAGPGGERHYLVEAGIQAPSWVKPYREVGLQLDGNAADYLMIAHATLLEAIEPLAEFHRQRGLKVVVVDVEHIYNEFNHGIDSPFAIREFIRHASEYWATPSPRYVLLVGDASFDVRDANTNRNLVPSMQVRARDELAASDNGFVTIQGDDELPDLAIGRIPAADATELSAVVRKILSYAETPAGEPWQRELALVSDASEDFQDISNELAVDLGGYGLQVNTIYPDVVPDNAIQDQEALIKALDSGQLLVHFLGHGGRFVWRTGPMDYKNASDLFKVSDLKKLQNADRLPLVLSMTCSSGPFDHPQASSIAEEFLLLPGNGAVGVLAASWRVPASQSFSTLLLDELLQAGQSVGEAILNAKRKEPRIALVESYNFLGDPAMVLRLPAGDRQP